MTLERIVHRDEIVKQQAAKTEQELAVVIKAVNAKLKAALALPMTFPEGEFGSTEWVRRELENRLRDSGWKVTSAKDDKNGRVTYQVQ